MNSLLLHPTDVDNSGFTLTKTGGTDKENGEKEQKKEKSFPEYSSDVARTWTLVINEFPTVVLIYNAVQSSFGHLSS